MFYITNNNTLH